MSRATVLRWVPHTELPCPVPGLLAKACYESPLGQWWVGSVGNARVLWHDGRLLEVSGPQRFSFGLLELDRSTPPTLVLGDLPSGPVRGVLEQPGTRGLRRLSLTRDSHRIVLRVDGRPDLWLRARSVYGADVRTGDGRRVAALKAGRDLSVQSDATPDEQALGVLLLTQVDHDALLAIGNL